MIIQDATSAIVPKHEFARLINVSRARVSQYVSTGQIHGPALKGEGRSARIVVDVARQQLRRVLDTAHAVGNGLETRLGASPAQTPAAPPPRAIVDEDLTGSSGDLLSDAIKAEKLKEIRAKNRRQEEEERLRRGTYVLATDAARSLRKVVDSMVQVFDGMLNEMASESVAHPGIPHRDLLHLFRTKARKIRADGEIEAKRRALELAPTIDDPVDGEAA